MILQTARLRERQATMKGELSVLAREIFDQGFERKAREFVAEYRRHEEDKEVLFRGIARKLPHSKATWPIHGYHHVREGARTMLAELERELARGHVPAVQRSFSNFYALVSSNLDYETEWVFPLLEGMPEEAEPFAACA